MYYYGYNSGYSYGAPNCGMPYAVYQGNNGIGNGAAIILVLFILLVIILGSRYVNN